MSQTELTVLEKTAEVGMVHAEKKLAALDKAMRVRIQARQPYLDAIKACQKAEKQAQKKKDVECLKDAYRRLWKTIDLLVLTDERDTIQELCNRAAEDLCRLTYASGNEALGRVLGNADYVATCRDLDAACQTKDLKQIESAIQARWVVANQLIDGTYATSELEGGPA